MIIWAGFVISLVLFFALVIYIHGSSLVSYVGPSKTFTLGRSGIREYIHAASATTRLHGLPLDIMGRCWISYVVSYVYSPTNVPGTQLSRAGKENTK